MRIFANEIQSIDTPMVFPSSPDQLQNCPADPHNDVESLDTDGFTQELETYCNTLDNHASSPAQVMAEQSPVHPSSAAVQATPVPIEASEASDVQTPAICLAPSVISDSIRAMPDAFEPETPCLTHASVSASFGNDLSPCPTPFQAMPTIRPEDVGPSHEINTSPQKSWAKHTQFTSHIPHDQQKLVSTGEIEFLHAQEVSTACDTSELTTGKEVKQCKPDPCPTLFQAMPVIRPEDTGPSHVTTDEKEHAPADLLFLPGMTATPGDQNAGLGSSKDSENLLFMHQTTGSQHVEHDSQGRHAISSLTEHGPFASVDTFLKHDSEPSCPKSEPSISMPDRFFANEDVTRAGQSETAFWPAKPVLRLDETVQTGDDPRIAHMHASQDFHAPLSKTAPFGETNPAITAHAASLHDQGSHLGTQLVPSVSVFARDQINIDNSACDLAKGDAYFPLQGSVTNPKGNVPLDQGLWQTCMQDAELKCDVPTPFQAKPLLRPEESGPSHTGIQATPVYHNACGKEIEHHLANQVPGSNRIGTSAHACPDFAVGAVPGFANKRKLAPCPTPPEKRPRATSSLFTNTIDTKVNSNLPDIFTITPSDTNPDLTSKPFESANSAFARATPFPEKTCLPDPLMNAGNTDTTVVPELAKHPNPEHSSPDEDSDQSPRQEACESSGIWVVHEEGIPVRIRVSEEHTAGQLTCAIDKAKIMHHPIKITDAMGVQIPASSILGQNQVVKVKSLTSDPVSKCPMGSHGEPPQLRHAFRAQLLWQQEGWVAEDEMRFYLSLLEGTFPSTIIGTVVLPEHIDSQRNFADFLLQHSKFTDSAEHKGALAVLRKNHWFPILLDYHSSGTTICAPPSELIYLQHGFAQLTERLDNIKFKAKLMPTSFPADCGFQTVGWILSMILEAGPIVPWTPQQAMDWRVYFNQYLIQTGQACAWIDRPLQIGGATTQERLQDLLIEHGVHKQRAQECANQLITALGNHTMQKILLSAKPWQDLKTRANMHSPPIRIVLADELKAMVTKRIQEGKPIGSKGNKIPTKKSQFVPLALQAEQIEIPFAVFKQSDGTEIGQITTNQLGPQSSGILVSNIENALPYFSLQAPVSQEGVGLLILEANDERIPITHTKVKVPVQCRASQEPIIITAALLQLGSKTTMRNLPENCLSIQETPNEVVRVIVYQDQYGGNWSDLLGRPVKTLMEQEPFAQLDKADFLDVWDRQFLSERFAKAKPDQAYCFAVNLRVTPHAAKCINDISGQNGVYSEPRSSDGRQPHGDFQVVWLLQRQFAQATLSQKTTSVPTQLVRSGCRYGLRMKNDDPSHWIYQLSHGDILISPMESDAQSSQVQAPVLASARTLQYLRQKPNPPDAKGTEDPWQHYDPWQKKSSKELSVAQVAAIEANLESKLTQKLKTEDAEMTAVDDRVVALESRVEQLAATVSANQTQQSQQTQVLTQQIAQIDRKVDGQTQMFHAALDAKLSDQMLKIEQLLSKRPRTGE
eukprot:s1561_g6.t1